MGVLVYMERDYLVKKQVYKSMHANVIEAEQTLSDGNDGKLVHVSGYVKPVESHELRD